MMMQPGAELWRGSVVKEEQCCKGVALQRSSVAGTLYCERVTSQRGQRYKEAKNGIKICRRLIDVRKTYRNPAQAVTQPHIHRVEHGDDHHSCLPRQTYAVTFVTSDTNINNQV